MRSFVKKYFPLFSLLFFVLFAITALLWYISSINPIFADLIVSGAGYVMRRALSALTEFTSFSLMEPIFIIGIILLVASVVRVFSRERSSAAVIRKLVGVVSLFAFLLSVYFYTLGVGYHTTPVYSKLSLERNGNISTDSLKNTVLILKSETEALLDYIEFTDGGASSCSLTQDEISRELCRAYEVLDSEYGGLNLKCFDSRSKDAVSSKVLVSLQITGIYSFYTGEATVSTSYPDYIIPFTIAHEFAHQRGIARENEANFMAFLACIRSESPYIRYSGYLNMIEYLLSSLKRADGEALKETYSILDKRIIGEMRAYSEFYYANKNELLEKISRFFNDNYLKAQGTEGIVSYGMVTELCVSYYGQ